MAVNTNAAVVVQPPLPEQATQDIRGIKPPLDLADGWSWVWWTVGILVVVVAAWIAYRLLKKKADRPAEVPVTLPHVVAKQRLQQALSLLSDPKIFCTEVSDTIRVYLEDRFHFRAPERTTEEFLLELQGTDLLLPDQKQSLGEFLQVCDLVKFARHEPNESTLRELQEAGCRLVDETRFDVESQVAAHNPSGSHAYPAATIPKHPPSLPSPPVEESNEPAPRP